MPRAKKLINSSPSLTKITHHIAAAITFANEEAKLDKTQMASSSSSLISYTFTLFFNLALSLLLLLSTLSKTSTQGSFSEEVSEAITLKRMEKTTHLHFYFHDIVSGKNPTAVKIAGAEDGSVMGFGTTFMMNDPLTEGPESNSKLVGRAQGMYALASEKNIPELLMVVYYEFEQGIYNGSSISILGRNPVYNDVREMPIVGGSGVFRFARGYALAHTIWLDAKTGDATVEYNVYVIHS